MSNFLLRIVWETWAILKEASVFLLFGFLIAGVLAVLVPQRLLSKLFGTGRIRSVLWGAAIGAPLPLCSCGVLPTALALRRQGATPGATVSFLIATPETGVDSISMSYALMDPLMTVARPVAAVGTAITAGLATNFLASREAASQAMEGDATAQVVHAHAHHEHGEDDCCAQSSEAVAHPAPGGGALTPGEKGRAVLRYAFRDLLDDISYWLVLGIVLSGLIAASLPADFFDRTIGAGLFSMLVMLVVGIPIYTCASSSTPLAAAMVMKGLNPGAALVFLLAGPATNIGSLVVLLRFLGARVVAIYLGSIVLVTLAAGLAVNWIYRTWNIDPRATFGAATAIVPEPVKIAGALLLCALLVWSMVRTPIPTEWRWLGARLRFGIHVDLRKLAATVGVLALGYYLASGFFMVSPGETAFVLRFGQIVSAPLDAGLHYRLPWPVETQRVVRTERIRRIEYGFANKAAANVPPRPAASDRMAGGWTPTPGSTVTAGTWFQKEAGPDEPFLLTGDGNLIDLRWTVQYRVRDARAFAFNVSEPDVLVRGLSLASLRAQVARSTIDAIYTAERSAIERRVLSDLQQGLDAVRSGVEVLVFNLRYVHPPDEVHDAFRDVASAQEDKLRTINRARIFAVETVNEAKGEAAAMVEQALAFKTQQMLRAEGEAASFLLRLQGYRAAPELTRFRLQVEALEETLPGLQKFVRPSAQDMKEFDMWLLQPVPVSGKATK